MVNGQTHRLVLGQVLAWAWLATAAFFAVDAVRRADGRTVAVVLLTLLAGSLVAVAFGLRPAVVEAAHGLVVRNPVRTTHLPWATVTHVDVTDVLRVHAGETVVRCFAVPRTRAVGPRTIGSGLGALPAAAPTEETVRPVSRSDTVQARLLAAAEQLGGLRGGPGVVSHWAWSGAGSLAAAVASGLLALLIASTG